MLSSSTLYLYKCLSVALVENAVVPATFLIKSQHTSNCTRMSYHISLFIFLFLDHMMST